MKKEWIEFIKTNPTVFLTVLTAYSYFCAYSFESGYCRYFKIPLAFIDIQVIDLIRFFALVVGVWGTYAITINNLFGPNSTFLKPKNYLNRLLQIFVTSSVVELLISNSMKVGPLFFRIYLGIVMGITIIYSVLFFINQRRIRRSALDQSNIVSNEGIDTTKTTSHFMENILNDIGASFYILCILIPTICYGLGYGNGSKITDFEVLNSPGNFVVLKKYGDNIICKNFNLKTKEISDSLIVFKLGADKPLKTSTKRFKD